MWWPLRSAAGAGLVAVGLLAVAGWGWAREARAAATEADCEWAATDVVNGHTPFRARTT